MIITGHTVETLKDPTGILEGERYEFIITIEVPEDDELYTENGLFIKAIVVVTESGTRIVQYHFFENTSNQYHAFALEEDEEAQIIEYCNKVLKIGSK